MQVTETLSEGLKREFRVVVPASELDAKMNAALNELKERIVINGFRPGKVPVQYLKRLYGRATMVDVIDATVREANSQIMGERGYKLAADPKITLPQDKDAIDRLVAGTADLDYTVAVEIVPPIALADFKAIALTRLTCEVEETEIEDTLSRLAEEYRPFAPRPPEGKAEKGDRLVVSYSGTIDGEPFEGGRGEDVVVRLGAGIFIPGFEDQLVGATAGESRTVRITFPTHYVDSALAGKEAVFAVTVKSVETPGAVTLDDAFAKTLGFESMAKLREAVRDRLAREHAAMSRQKLKRALLDELDRLHKFEPPPTLVEEEFDRIWRSVLQELESERKTFADENTTEEKARAEYRAIAERRVRLGLVLAEIGEKNNIAVTDEELNRALMEHVRRFPGQERRAWEYYRQNPQALAGLRAPIFEEKVVDFLLELATVTERRVARAELYKDDEQTA